MRGAANVRKVAPEMLLDGLRSPRLKNLRVLRLESTTA
jgi:hypothetical protein